MFFLIFIALIRKNLNKKKFKNDSFKKYLNYFIFTKKIRFLANQ